MCYNKMRLDRVEIDNFRSIKEATISFYPKCRILIGKAESGKSNILEALSMLDEEKEPTPLDMREIGLNESPLEDSNLTFVFKLNKTEIKQVFNNIKSTILTEIDDPIVLTEGKKEIFLSNHCQSMDEGLYIIDIEEKIKSPGFWGMEEGITMAPNLKKISDKCPKDYFIKNSKGGKLYLSKYKLIDIKISKQKIPSDFFEELTAEEFQDIIGEEIKKIVEQSLPSCLFWKYDEKYILPNEVKLSEFSSNPSICEPLKEMFHFAGYKDITNKINLSKETPKGLKNLLNKVAEKTTKHLHEIWPEYISIKFELSLNGESIDISVKDEFNNFGFFQRSDGFKRFMTFLLIVSLKVKTGNLDETLILLDEPGEGLHPSAERCLRNEIINISKKNYVLYSTHSISMIDGDNIKRHLIVKKGGEITSVEEAGQSNISDEEVLYNALGYSMFETLKKKNILFEGWRDKKLFKIAMENLPTTYSHLSEFFREFGFCHGGGASNIKNIIPILKLANRECFIVSDSDKPAKQHQKEFKKHNLPGSWICHDEMLPEELIVTSEDFIKPNTFKKVIQKIRKDYPALGEITDDELLREEGKISILKKWLQKEKIPNNEWGKILNQIKEEIFSQLQASDIQEKYYEFLNNLADFINNKKSSSITKN